MLTFLLSFLQCKSMFASYNQPPYLEPSVLYNFKEQWHQVDQEVASSDSNQDKAYVEPRLSLTHELVREAHQDVQSDQSDKLVDYLYCSFIAGLKHFVAHHVDQVDERDKDTDDNLCDWVVVECQNSHCSETTSVKAENNIDHDDSFADCLRDTFDKLAVIQAVFLLNLFPILIDFSLF